MSSRSFSLTALILEINANMMKNEMIDALSGESIGGNAKSIVMDGKGYQCGAVNGYINSQTGEIIEFTNYEPKVADTNLCSFTFRIAIGRWFIPLKIVGLGIDRKLISENAKRILEASMNAWDASRAHLFEEVK